MVYNVQVHINFLQETPYGQENCFLPSIAVNVNRTLCPQPNPIPRYEPQATIRSIGTLYPTVANQHYINYLADYGRYSTRKLSSTELLSRLKSRGVRHSDYTRGLIKEKFNEGADREVEMTSLRVSLACPLGKMRMVTPCRASTCLHLQCFDALLFLQMNERKPMWNCPICNKPALYDTLVIDAYFEEVLYSKKLLPDVNEIQLLQDGSWENLVPKKGKDKDKTEMNVIMNTQDREIDVDTIDLDEINPTPLMEWNRDVVIDLTSGRDDDYDDDDYYDDGDEYTTLTQSTSGTFWPKNSQTSFISSTSESLDLSVIYLE